MTGAVLQFVAYPPPLALFTDGLSQNIIKIKQKKEPLNSNLQKKSKRAAVIHAHYFAHSCCYKAIFTSCSFITKSIYLIIHSKKVIALRSVFFSCSGGGGSCVYAGLESHHHLFWCHPAPPFPPRQHKGRLRTMKCNFGFL